MDEDQFRSTYREVNPNRCVFEKAINNRRCDCAMKRRFVIATREGVACRSEMALRNCSALLDTMRDNARFVLKVITVDGPMPHNKELRVQAGGMLGLQKLLFPELESPNPNDKAPEVINIHSIVDAALEKHGSIDNIPYRDIIKDIASCKVRIKRKSR